MAFRFVLVSLRFTTRNIEADCGENIILNTGVWSTFYVLGI